MGFICTPLSDQRRDSRAARAINAEEVWVRFLLEIVFRQRLDPEVRVRLGPYLQENMHTLIRRGLLFPKVGGLVPLEAKFDVREAWMLSAPVLEMRFNQTIPMDQTVRDDLARLLEESLNLAIKEGRLFGNQRTVEPLAAWVRAHPDQRCWPSPSLL